MNNTKYYPPSVIIGSPGAGKNFTTQSSLSFNYGAEAGLQIVAAAEFNDPHLQEMVRVSYPEMRLSLATNPQLKKEVWEKLYTRKPKPELLLATLLVSRKLTKAQIEHLRWEKRSQVWAKVMEHNYLEPELVKQLAQEKKLDSRIRLTPASSNYYQLLKRIPSDLTLLEDTAANSTIRELFNSLREVGPSVNFIKTQLGTDQQKWSIFFSLVGNFEGSLTALCRSVNELSE